ncbi:MAG: CPBP family intramembrane metalloprotease, partial [candidate division Zixibacteria bacterium]|nr:CPBP family intramembrane metalloprotease [candidate division Zixibacteria bacterium]
IAGFVLAGISSFFTMKGFEFTKELSLTQVIIFIWIYASVSEEFLTRGLILGFLAPLSKRGIQIFKFRISVPVIVSALFFGFMHMGLITMGANTITMLIVILSAVILGIIAGYYREKTESIIPAIIIHMLFNVWGTIIG